MEQGKATKSNFGNLNKTPLKSAQKDIENINRDFSVEFGDEKSAENCMDMEEENLQESSTSFSFVMGNNYGGEVNEGLNEFVNVSNNSVNSIFTPSPSNIGCIE